MGKIEEIRSISMKDIAAILTAILYGLVIQKASGGRGVVPGLQEGERTRYSDCETGEDIWTDNAFK